MFARFPIMEFCGFPPFRKERERMGHGVPVVMGWVNGVPVIMGWVNGVPVIMGWINGVPVIMGWINGCTAKKNNPRRGRAGCC
jgi:hypothetical protein